VLSRIPKAVKAVIRRRDKNSLLVSIRRCKVIVDSEDGRRHKPKLIAKEILNSREGDSF
jgi:hypothetical protein